MKNLFIFLLFGLFLISFVSADVSIGTVKQNQVIQLTQTCSNCTYVNLTSVLYPNNTYALNGQYAMTKTNENFNYTFTDTSALGEYIYTTCGDLNGINTCQSVRFEVTPSGTLFTNALSLPIFLPMILVGVLALVFFLMVGFTEKKEYKYTFIIFGGIFVIFGIAYGIIASRDFLYGFPLLYGFVNSFYKIFIITLRVGAILIPIIVAFFVIKRIFNRKGYNIVK